MKHSVVVVQGERQGERECLLCWMTADNNSRLSDWVLRHQQKCTKLEQLVLCACEHNVHVNNPRLQEHRATSRHRGVIVQLVSSQPLFIRGVKADGYCLSAATGPLLHIDDWNEHEVALADNCRRTRVSPFTSTISPAARFTPFCPSFLPLFLCFLSKKCFPVFFYYPAITAYLQW